MRRTWWVLALAMAVMGGSSCSLNFVKRRLPAPRRQADGAVLFRYDAPSARVVQLAGDWPQNDWLKGQAQTGSYLVGIMDDVDGDGVWERREPLPPGRYQYKFVVDEQNWKEDPNNPQRVDDGFGGFNSLVIID